jgi:hypothetical protein
MLDIVNRLLPKGVHLKRVIRRMPHELVRRFGGGAHYTPGQVRRVARDLGVTEAHLPYAFAAACTRDEFAKALPDAGAEAYDQLRAELVERFRIERDNFTVLHLTAKGPSVHASEGGSM